MSRTRQQDRKDGLQNHLSADICSTMGSQLEQDLKEALDLLEAAYNKGPNWVDIENFENFLIEHKRLED